MPWPYAGGRLTSWLAVAVRVTDVPAGTLVALAVRLTLHGAWLAAPTPSAPPGDPVTAAWTSRSAATAAVGMARLLRRASLSGWKVMMTGRRQGKPPGKRKQPDEGALHMVILAPRRGFAAISQGPHSQPESA